ncbi:hypothetical protein Gpo141_00013916, partial [Globisporangium polare]
MDKLETELSDERSSRKDLQQLCEQLRSGKHELELEKRKSESEFACLNSEKRQVDSEKALLSRQLKELVESQKEQEQSTALEGHAELTKQKWEIEQLQATLKIVEGDKTLLDERAKQLESEIESLVATNHQLQEKNRAGTQKAMELENKARVVAMERDRVSNELQTASAELVKWKERAEKKQKELDQTMLSLRSLEAGKETVDEALAKEKLEKNDLVAQKGGLENKARAMTTERDLVSDQLQTASTGLMKWKERAEELSRTIDQLRQQVDKLETKLSDERSSRKDLQQLCEQLRSGKHELELEKRKSESEFACLNSEKRQVDSEKALLSRQLKELVESQKEQEQSTALEGHAELTKQKWEIEQLQATLKIVEGDKTLLDERAKQLESEIESLVATNHQLQEKNRAGTQKAMELENKARVVAMERDRVSNELQTASAELVKWKERAEKKQKELDQTMLSLRSLEAGKEAAGVRMTGFAHLGSSEAMLVKLQLADVNKGELEAHLADCASQLEISNRRCAALEARCRDQAVDMESLHVEVSSLRAGTQKMHLSALETLSLMERLDYEHKKRALKSDFQIQLRDFQEREDQALIRHKARLRSQCEQQLDDLLAELEKKKQVRMEQEDALTLQIFEQIRQEREVKRKELRRQVREEMQELERELTERKDHHLQTITDVIRKEEEALSARVRESRQTLREEELVRVNSKQQSNNQFPPSPGEVPSQQHLSFKDDDEDEHDEFIVVDEFATSSPRRKSSNNNKSHHRPSRAESRVSSSMKMQKQKSRSTKELRKWGKRLEDENELLSKAKSLVANQRRELKKQVEQLKRDKDEWRRDRNTTRNPQHNAILQEMKHMIEQNTVTLNQSVKQLREREVWVKKRELNIAKMQRTVDKLRPKRSSSRARSGKNNSGYLSD